MLSGDYAILKAVQRTLPELGVPREDFVFVSGIGCSSRLPYYLATYGFHTIHGRAPAIATGIKGVLCCDPAPSCDERVHRQVAEVSAKAETTDLNALLRQGNTWTVEP